MEQARTIQDVYRCLDEIDEQVRRVRVVLAVIKSHEEGPPREQLQPE